MYKKITFLFADFEHVLEIKVQIRTSAISTFSFSCSSGDVITAQTVPVAILWWILYQLQPEAKGICREVTFNINCTLLMWLLGYLFNNWLLFAWVGWKINSVWPSHEAYKAWRVKKSLESSFYRLFQRLKGTPPLTVSNMWPIVDHYYSTMDQLWMLCFRILQDTPKLLVIHVGILLFCATCR